MIVSNPAGVIGKVKVRPKKLELPSREKFEELLRTIESTGAGSAQDCADLVRFLAFCAARKEEAAHVKFVDVDNPLGSIRIHGPEATGVKRGDSRSVPIIPPMRELLERLKTSKRRPKNPRRRGAGFIMNVTECRKALDNACQKIGVAHITHHDLRHLFATRCIEAGVDIPTVSRWLGHQDGGALAMRSYGHLRDEHSQTMAAKVTF